MTVQDLIQLLEEQDPTANVYLMTQRRRPFEYSLSGVTVREAFDDQDGEPTDVFILEGTQLAYGNRDAWSCRTP